MNIIPKDQVEEETRLSLQLIEKEQAYARLAYAYQKEHPEFKGTAEQVAQLEKSDAKTQLFSAYSDCAYAAARVNASGYWFEDVQKMIQQLRDQDNKTEE